jgi:riboflavin biosynthesis pyrimidine reductase
MGVELIAAPHVSQVAADIHARGATHVLVEPGPTLAHSMFQENTCDRLWVIRSQKKVDDATAPSVAAIPPEFVQSGQRKLKGDILTEYLNQKSPAFYANSASADLMAVGES